MKKHYIWKIVLGGCLGLGALAACGDKNEADDGGTGNCGITSEVTYSGQIKSLLDTNCISCHSASTTLDGVALDTFNDAKSHASSSVEQVESNKMPYGGPPLSADDKCLLSTWVEQGTKN